MRKFTPYLIISAIIFGLYFRSLFFGFTFLDDNTLILDNLGFIKNLANVFTAFNRQVFFNFGSSAYYYRPLLTVSFILDAQLSGAGPFFYHLTNIVIHIVVSCLVFLFLKKLKFKEISALIFALIFSVHPVLTQAVAWIPGRNDSLLTVFILASFISFLEKKYYWHLVFFLVALFIKETAIILPLTLFAYNYLITKNKNLWIGWGIIIAIWLVFRQGALGNGSPETGNLIFSSIRNLPAVLLYLGKIFFPFNLSVLPVLVDSTLIYGILALGLILIIVFLKKEKRWKYVIFGALWFLVFLVPALIKPNISEMPDFIEHRIYLPMIGLLIILAETISVVNIFAAIVIGFLAILTFLHMGNFADRVSFWQNAVQKSPHFPLTHRNLGAMYFLDNKFDLAKEEFEKTLILNPYEPMVHNNLGLIYMNRTEYDLAEREFIQELKFYPSYENGYFNLGILYYRMGKEEEAIKMWEKTISLNPDFYQAYINLIYFYQAKNNPEKAGYYLNILKLRGY